MVMHVRIGWSRLVVVALALGTSASATAADVRPPSFALGARSCQVSGGAAAPSGHQPSVVSAVRAGRSVARPASQVTVNERANITFELRLTESGAVEVSGRTPGLQIRKTVQSSGDFVLELTHGTDIVTVSGGAQGLAVSRGTSRVELPRANVEEAQVHRARRLLADSKAVPAFRGIAAALIEADDRSPSSLALIMADATLGMLTGDVGASRRVAQFLARPGLAKVRRASMAIGCFDLMESRLVDAWNDLFACSISVYPNGFYLDLCSIRWALQVESYWFSFLSCTGFNW